MRRPGRIISLRLLIRRSLIFFLKIGIKGFHEIHVMRIFIDELNAHTIFQGYHSGLERPSDPASHSGGGAIRQMDYYINERARCKGMICSYKKPVEGKVA